MENRRLTKLRGSNLSWKKFMALKSDLGFNPNTVAYGLTQSFLTGFDLLNGNNPCKVLKNNNSYTSLFSLSTQLFIF